MLFRLAILDGIRRGAVTVAFRRWKKPAVKVGGRLRTRAGVIEFTSVRPASARSITDADAKKAGYASADALRTEMARWARRAPAKPGDRRGTAGADGRLYRVTFKRVGEDPRVLLRRKPLSPADRAAIDARLARLDAASSHGLWTLATLRAIAKYPGRRAPDLAASFGRETLPFKLDVRKLKELGLTESLAVGYRLSPRGRAYLKKR